MKISTNSLTLRLTLMFSLASLVVLLILGFSINAAIDQNFIEEDGMLIQPRLPRLRRYLTPITNQAQFDALCKSLDQISEGSHRHVFVIADNQGRVLYPNYLDQLPDCAMKAPFNTLFVWEANGERMRGMKGPFTTQMPGLPGGIMVLSVKIDHHVGFLSSFHHFMWCGMALAAAFMGLLGWLAVRLGLSPLRQLVRSTSKITATQLNTRLSIETVPVELQELTHSLNQMLARLEESFHRLSDFSSDLAHELRTPINTLMMQSQVTLSKLRTADEYRDCLYSIAEELEHMTRLVSDLLYLAKADYGLIVPGVEALVLRDELQKLIDFYEALASENHLSFSLTGQGTINGDPNMLRRAFGNLLLNAVTYGQPDSTIQIQIEPEDGGGVLVTIANLGDTIPPDHLARLFDRFYRVDGVHSRSDTNVGLGLAIAQSIIRAHQGTIEVTSENGVTCFWVRLRVVG